MTPTVQSILRTYYDLPMFEGLPQGTQWAGDPDHPMWWDPSRDRCLFGLVTHWWVSNQHIYTMAEIKGSELDRFSYTSGLYAWQEIVHEKLKLLRIQHYFNVVYSRGGYC